MSDGDLLVLIFSISVVSLLALACTAAFADRRWKDKGEAPSPPPQPPPRPALTEKDLGPERKELAPHYAGADPWRPKDKLCPHCGASTPFVGRYCQRCGEDTAPLETMVVRSIEHGGIRVQINARDFNPTKHVKVVENRHGK